MSFKSVDVLIDALLRLRLVEQAQLEECLEKVNRNSAAPSLLLAHLEHKHFLTSYQLSRLSRGETAGLVLGNCKLMYRNASGSFARVFRGMSLDDGQMIGIKVLRQRWANDKLVVAEFHREAELCMRLHHKNIVPIYNVGSEGDYHYFTMEFVEGGNLRDFINIRKRVEPLEACRYALDMAEGLDHALSRGLTHRDFKRTNVLMTTDGVAKLVDFGLAGSDASTDPKEGKRRAIEYAALEDGTGAPWNDPRSDLFFMGAVFYELVTGAPPFTAAHTKKDRQQLSRYSHVPPVREVNPKVPAVVAEIVERLLKINPIERYQRPHHVVGDLVRTIAELDPNAQSTRKTHDRNDGLPTVMCIEHRIKQQNLLRDYLTKHGYRVLMLSDLQRGLNRLKSDPPNCVVLFGESIGNAILDGFNEALRWAASNPVLVIAILAKEQANWKSVLEESPKARVLVQPVALRELRDELNRLGDSAHA